MVLQACSRVCVHTAALTRRSAAPRCGHCKHLTPEYKKLGAQISGDPKLSSRVVVAKVLGHTTFAPL